MDSIQAAILTVKLKYLEDWTHARIRNANLYNAALGNCDQVAIPKIRSRTRHTFHLYVIRAQRRDELKKFLESKGIETAIHYPTPLPFLEAYRRLGHQITDFPTAAKLQTEILSLPMFAELSDHQIEYITSTILSFYRK